MVSVRFLLTLVWSLMLRLVVSLMRGVDDDDDYHDERKSVCCGLACRDSFARG